eukprot:gnl/Hemi2/7673_TR2641_c0_g1_i1.p3 gnl/Hemi2/7673_TR2641_c0_g1~~gnl/Hemi2/7673_TR2641_c0_g1_i1.p3  ORF type:complete len:161 (-),score=53.08 gnl/Hemi2/7673_TR2641_c0_g1_i1:129-581(-)
MRLGLLLLAAAAVVLLLPFCQASLCCCCSPDLFGWNVEAADSPACSEAVSHVFSAADLPASSCSGICAGSKDEQEQNAIKKCCCCAGPEVDAKLLGPIASLELCDTTCAEEDSGDFGGAALLGAHPNCSVACSASASGDGELERVDSLDD